MIAIGIDPGLKGGVAVITRETVRALYPMPVLNKTLDCITLSEIIGAAGWSDDDIRVAVERQGYRLGQTGVGTVLVNYGRILATLELGRCRYVEVTPPVWNRALKIPAGLKGRAKKGEAFRIASQRWPGAIGQYNLTPSKDGMVEALLIATWALDNA